MLSKEKMEANSRISDHGEKENELDKGGQEQPRKQGLRLSEALIKKDERNVRRANKVTVKIQESSENVNTSDKDVLALGLIHLTNEKTGKSGNTISMDTTNNCVFWKT